MKILFYFCRMKWIKIITIASLCFSLQQCMVDENKENSASTQAQSQKNIVVYGSDECSHCVDFKKQLDSAGYEYTFYDVEKDQSKGDEMLLKVQQTGFRGNISFPVIVVDGAVKVAPSFQDLEQSL